MKTLAQQTKVFTKAYNAFMAIENDNDLRRNNLTVAEYRMLYDVLVSLCKIQGVYSLCLSKNVAMWCRKYGLQVEEPHGNEVNYKIYC